MSDTINQDASSHYRDEYIPYIVKWGRIINLLAIPVVFLPVIVLALVYGFMPPISAIIEGSILVLSIMLIITIVEPISYFPILGIPGTYMAFLAGNIGNMRLPCSAIAQEAAGVEPGSEQGSVISTIGIAVSIIVNIVVLTIGVFAGTAVLSQLPESIVSAFNFILPSLFGAVFAQFAVKQPLLGLVAISIAILATCLEKFGLFAFLPGMPIYMVIIISIFGTVISARVLHKKGIIK